MKTSKIQIFVTTFVIAIAILCLYVALNEKLIVKKNHFISNFLSFRMQSDDISCGPACVSMVLDYYSVFHVYDEIRTETKTEWFVYKNEKYGMTIPRNIVSTLKKHHVPCSVSRGNLQLLEDNISRNKPVICLVRSGRYTWHYVVVIGFSPNNIYIGNPSNGSLECISKKIFYESWSFYGDINRNTYSFFDSMILLLRTASIYPNVMIV